jgi:Flp pilus assembly protein TadD
MTAVRLYPTDEAANLNAANVLLSKRRTDDAERYLKQAGDSPEAQYARGISAMMRTNYRAAIGYLHKAQAGGIKEADEVLRQVALFSDEKETQEPSRPAFFSRRR